MYLNVHGREGTRSDKRSSRTGKCRGGAEMHWDSGSQGVFIPSVVNASPEWGEAPTTTLGAFAQVEHGWLSHSLMALNQNGIRVPIPQPWVLSEFRFFSNPWVGWDFKTHPKVVSAFVSCWPLSHPWANLLSCLCYWSVFLSSRKWSPISARTMWKCGQMSLLL